VHGQQNVKISCLVSTKNKYYKRFKMFRVKYI